MTSHDQTARMAIASACGDHLLTVAKLRHKHSCTCIPERMTLPTCKGWLSFRVYFGQASGIQLDDLALLWVQEPQVALPLKLRKRA